MTSFGIGRRSRTFEQTYPLMEEYAGIVGADFYVPEDSFFDDFIEKNIELNWDARSAPTWLKIPLVSHLLEKYDEVLWLDADVVVTGQDDVFLEAQDSPIAMTLLDVDAGSVANTGVWLSRKPAKEFIDNIEINPRVAYGSRRWREVGYDGEMPMILDALGVDVKARHIEPPTSSIFGELDYKFHVNLDDKRGVPENAVFFHSLGVGVEWIFSAIVTYNIWDLQRYYRTVHHKDPPGKANTNNTWTSGKRGCCRK